MVDCFDMGRCSNLLFFLCAFLILCCLNTTAQIHTLPKALLASFTKNVCVGTPAFFKDSSLLADSWQWYFEGGTPNTFSGKTPPSIIYTTPGKFPVRLIVANVNGLDSIRDSVRVNPNPAIPGTIAEHFIRYGDSIQLGACVSGATYRWMPGISTDSTSEYYSSAIADGKYRCTVTNIYGCPANCEYIVRVTPMAKFLLDSTKICMGQKNEVYNQSGSGVYWDWYFEGGAPEKSAFRDPDPVLYKNPGRYLVRLIVRNANGSDTLTDIVEVSAPPVVSAGQTFEVDVLKSFRLKACISGTRYVWTPSMTSDSITPDLYLSEARKEYTCKVYLSSGCAVTCKYNIIADKAGVFVPNVFSPNGDGINEMFEPVGLGITWYELSIHNSWGVLVSKTTDTGWDGKSENAPSPPGTYVWTLLYKQGESKLTKTLQGTVLLLR